MLKKYYKSPMSVTIPYSNRQLLSPLLWKEFLLQGLREDMLAFDWTSHALESKPARADIIAKAAGVWASQGLCTAAHLVSIELGRPVRFESLKRDGERLNSGDRVCSLEGDLIGILQLERTFLNLASYAAGIATHTRAFVDGVQASSLRHKPRIVPTRKTLPYYRDLAIGAVIVGGGFPHRIGLSGGVLIKENHIAGAGGIRQAIERARQNAPHTVRIEVEVRNLKELRDAIDARAEVIMLDNFSPAQVREALALQANPRPVFEVSGGIHLETLQDYLIEGVDVLSIGSLTHSVRALDLSLLVR